MQKRLEVQVSGRVQLVMFRDFVTRNARSRGLKGTVRNNPDGTVLAVIEGEESKILEILGRIRKGSLLSRIDNVEEKWSEPLGEFKSFDILYS